MIVVLGAAESGTGAAMLAKKMGLDVFVSDKGPIEDGFKNDLARYGVHWEEGGHTENKIMKAGEVIKSPGIPDNAPIVRMAMEKNIPVVSEIEFAGRYTTAKKICVTGSNGKTTTASMIYHIFKKAGLHAGLGGNIGTSLGRLLAESKSRDYDFLVLELSSFQLDNMEKFKADIAVITNITKNHMNRYDNDMQRYINSKFRITNNQGGTDHLVYFLDDVLTVQEIGKRNLKMNLYPFTSSAKPVDQGAYISNNQIITIINNKPTHMFIHELALIGRHNQFNTMAASIVARIVDIDSEVIRQSFTDIQPIEHRMEYVATVKGIDFYNDSKATTVNSTWWALESISKPVILILGGEDNKGNDWSILNELMKSKVKGLICLGLDNKKILKAFQHITDPVYEVKSMNEAVMLAYRLGFKGDVVLLSPGCASFDLFNDFEDRGWQFKRAVRAL